MSGCCFAERVRHAVHFLILPKAAPTGDGNHLTGHTSHVAAFIASVEKLEECYCRVPYRRRIDLERFGEVAWRPSVPQRMLVRLDISVFGSGQLR